MTSDPRPMAGAEPIPAGRERRLSGRSAAS